MAKNVTKTLKIATVIDESKTYWYNPAKEAYEKHHVVFDYKYIESKDLEIGFYDDGYKKSHNINGLDVERHARKLVCVFLYKVSVPENIFMDYGNIWCTEADALRSDVISRVLGGENIFEATFINPDNMKLAQLDITAKDEAVAKKIAKAQAKEFKLMLVKLELKPTTETPETEISVSRRYGMKHDTFISLAQQFGSMERLM